MEAPVAPPTPLAWLAATRPRTLPVAIAPVLLGTALALHDGYVHPLAALAAAAGALFIQMGTNLVNDYYDHQRGADRFRQGPARASAQGWLPPRHVLYAGLASFAIAALVGLYLIQVAGWPILAIGLASLASGYAYTGGPYPLGYHGWGEVFVFLFFGVASVAGTYYVQTLTVTTAAWVLGAAMGCLAATVLVSNNLRDIPTDAAAGKRTLAVRLGERATRAEYVLLTLLPYALAASLAPFHDLRALYLLIALPCALFVIHRAFKARTTADHVLLLGASVFHLVLYAFGVSAALVIT